MVQQRWGNKEDSEYPGTRLKNTEIMQGPANTTAIKKGEEKGVGKGGGKIPDGLLSLGVVKGGKTKYHLFRPKNPNRETSRMGRKNHLRKE